MSGHDTELDQLRAGVSCAALLERLQPGWMLDKGESTPRCLKYRRGAGEVLIINHQGRGWWDPMSDAKGDVFSLTQHLDPGLNFGQVRKLLRGMVGVRPSWLPLADSALRHLPRFVVYNRLNTWGRGREMPPVPKQTFHQWHAENRAAKAGAPKP